MNKRVLSACLMALALGATSNVALDATGNAALDATGNAALDATGNAALGAAAPVSVAAAGAGEDARSLAKAQVEFGIEVARKELWREAAYRFEKAVETDPGYAAAWNNLAIAYEQQGNFNDANKAYTKAVELDPNNMLIRQNYDLFKEIYDRLSRRRR